MSRLADVEDHRTPLLDMDVLCWRYDELIRSGYPVDDALEIAELSYVDLHRACELLAQGASVDEAVRILL